MAIPQNQCTPRRHPGSWGGRSALLAIVVWICWASMGVARDQAGQPSCDACGRGLVAEAAGQPEAAAGRAICRACYHDSDHTWASIDRHRYATFADGTLIDLKHFRASMLVSQAGGLAVGRACCGIAAANLAGWGVEWTQAAEGHVGGQPFGGNEDLRSNLAGSLFGQLAMPASQRADWAVRAIRFLELFHGPLHSVSERK